MRAAFLIAFCQYKVKPAVVNCPSFHYRGGPESFFAFQVDCRQRDVGPHSGVPLSMSPIRGDVKKKILPFLSEGRRMMLWLASSPISVLERLWARRVFRKDQAVGGLYSTVS